jgi:nucleoside triphosphate pyrophosphatase
MADETLSPTEGRELQLPPLILASASPRRSQLLRQLEVDFRVVPSPAVEVQPEHLTPNETCQINAYRKARAVAKDHPDHLVLGADTVVCLGTRMFGKPKDKTEAGRMLGDLQGHTHEVLTGVCLIYLRTHRQVMFAARSLVSMRPLDRLTVERYLALVDPLDKAGAYAIQEHADMIIDRVEGSVSNVIGLPMERLFEALAGWKVEA